MNIKQIPLIISLLLCSILAAYSVVSSAATPSTPSNQVTISDLLAITDFQLSSPSNGKQQPVTFGQVFKHADIPAGSALYAVNDQGKIVPLQFDVKATNSDKSVRHGILTGIFDTSSTPQRWQLFRSKTPQSAATSNVTLSSVLSSGANAQVVLQIVGERWQAQASDAGTSNSDSVWLNGPKVNEWIIHRPFLNKAGQKHPHLAAEFHIRYYPELKRTRIDTVVNNGWTYTPNPQHFIYDAQVSVANKQTATYKALKHYRQARWHRIDWVGGEPDIFVSINTPYFLSTRATPSYDLRVKIDLAHVEKIWSILLNKQANQPMSMGLVEPYMGTTGARPDIGPQTSWVAAWLLSQHPTAKKVMLANADAAMAFPVHYRNPNNFLTTTIDEYPYLSILANPGDMINPKTGKSEMLPACKADISLCKTPNNPDTSHQPSLTYVPYLVTGDYIYLEEMDAWTGWNLIDGNPYYRNFNKGLVKWDQVRGQAWAMRSITEAAWGMPDNFPHKAYFNDKLQQNLTYFRDNVANNPNISQLGALEYSNRGKTSVFMNDFLVGTWGWIRSLGYSEADAILNWNARFAIGRVTDPNFCWPMASSYELVYRKNNLDNAPYVKTFAELYAQSYPDLVGLKCDSPEWRAKSGLKPNLVWGYSNLEPDSFPAILQAALAGIYDLNLPNGQTAWKKWAARPVTPDYSKDAQFAIYPWSLNQVNASAWKPMSPSATASSIASTTSSSSNTTTNTATSTNTTTNNTNSNSTSTASNSSSDCNINMSAGHPLKNLAPGAWYSTPCSFMSKVKPNPVPVGASGTASVMSAWGGGAFDSKRNRLMVWGGGHNDYSGNEVYAFDVNSLQWQRLTNPSSTVCVKNAKTGACTEEPSNRYIDGLPRAAHSYDGLEYIPTIDRFCLVGTRFAYPLAAYSSKLFDCLNPATNTWDKQGNWVNNVWQEKSPYPRNASVGGVSGYDSSTGRLWLIGYGASNLSSYDLSKGDAKTISTTNWVQVNAAAINEAEKRMVAIGNGVMYSVDLQKPAEPKLVTSSGATEALKGTTLEYDPIGKQLVSWNGGNTIYTLRGNVWQKHSLTPLTSGFNPKPTTNGVFGRLRYVAAYDVFVLATDVDKEVLFFKLPASARTGISTTTPATTPTATPVVTAAPVATSATVTTPTTPTVAAPVTTPTSTPATQTVDANCNKTWSKHPLSQLAAGSWYIAPCSLLDNVKPTPLPAGSSGFAAITDAWSGGAFDTKRNRLMIWGGGYSDYSGNEVYAFDVASLKWQRLTEPSAVVCVKDAKGGCSEAASGRYIDGLPRSTETVDTLEYVANIDRFCSLGSYSPYRSNTRGLLFDCFNPATSSWEKQGKWVNNVWKESSPYPRALAAGGVSGYDSSTGRLWHIGYGSSRLASYDLKKANVQNISGANWIQVKAGAVNEAEKRFVAIGNGLMYAVDLKKPAEPTLQKASGNTEVLQGSTLEYDPIGKQLVSWNGGNTVYTLRGNVWQAHNLTPLSGANTVPTTNGIFGRLRYVPAYDAFILVTGVKKEAMFFKLPASARAK